MYKQFLAYIFDEKNRFSYEDIENTGLYENEHAEVQITYIDNFYFAEVIYDPCEIFNFKTKLYDKILFEEKFPSSIEIINKIKNIDYEECLKKISPHIITSISILKGQNKFNKKLLKHDLFYQSYVYNSKYSEDLISYINSNKKLRKNKIDKIFPFYKEYKIKNRVYDLCLEAIHEEANSTFDPFFVFKNKKITDKNFICKIEDGNIEKHGWTINYSNKIGNKETNNNFLDLFVFYLENKNEKELVSIIETYKHTIFIIIYYFNRLKLINKKSLKKLIEIYNFMTINHNSFISIYDEPLSKIKFSSLKI